MNMCNHILLVMDSSIWIRVFFSVDNAPKNIFRHTKIAAHVVYILTSNNPVAYAFLSGNDFDRVWQVPNIIYQIVDAKRTFTVKTILNVIRVAATVVWALGIKARGIWVAFVYLNGMSLTAFVNVWKRTCILSQDPTTTNVSRT